MSKVTSWAIAAKLVEAGVFTQEQINETRRIVIDIPADGVPVMYIERCVPESMVKILTDHSGIRIVYIGEDNIEREVRESPSP